MRLLILIIASSTLVNSSPSTDPRFGRCDTDFSARWPNGLPDEILTWTANEKSDLSSPVFRIFSEKDVRIVEPETDYKFVLKRLDDETKMNRFLITIDRAAISDDQQSNMSDETCNDFGMLKSLSDKSEHLSYKCFRYLLERSFMESSLQEVMFEWRTPKCGCFEISAEVLDQHNKIYSKDDDRFVALNVKACVRKVEDGEGRPAQQKPDNELIAKTKEIYEQEMAVENLIQDNDPSENAEPLPVAAALVETDEHDEAKSNEASKKITQKEKKKERRNRRKTKKWRKGKKVCCSAGVETKMTSQGEEDCVNVPADVIEKVMNRFQFPAKNCSKIFKKCCEDDVIGEKKLRKLRRKTSGKGLRHEESTEN